MLRGLKKSKTFTLESFVCSWLEADGLRLHLCCLGRQFQLHLQQKAQLAEHDRFGMREDKSHEHLKEEKRGEPFGKQ